MGLIKAIVGATGGVLADQWKEYFICDSIENDILIKKGMNKTSKRSSNKKGEDNVISDGSRIAVNEGQCMIIVDGGKVAEVCAEPGEYVYNNKTAPSLFTGSFGESLKETFKNIGYRFTFGGGAGHDQRVYYVNTKEIMGNKYGTVTPVPFRVVDNNIGLDVDISIRCFGEYSVRVVDPIRLFSLVAGNVEDEYSIENMRSMLKSELLTALQPAFARISAVGTRYSALPGYTLEITEALNDILSDKWTNKRGIKIETFGMDSVSALPEDEAMIKDMQKKAVYRNASMGAAAMVDAQAEAMKAAASNQGGAMMGFMGLGMAQQAGGFNAQSLYNIGAQQQQSAPASTPMQKPVWKCSCGAENTGAFCMECESKKPEPKATWKCSCGTENTGAFCMECGSKKPEASGSWKCSCGAENKGKFCSECGAKKPAGAPLYRCDKCGWTPADPKNPPKFCPECGDRFDDDDVQ